MIYVLVSFKGENPHKGWHLSHACGRAGFELRSVSPRASAFNHFAPSELSHPCLLPSLFFSMFSRMAHHSLIALLLQCEWPAGIPALLAWPHLTFAFLGSFKPLSGICSTGLAFQLSVPTSHKQDPNTHLPLSFSPGQTPSFSSTRQTSHGLTTSSLAWGLL